MYKALVAVISTLSEFSVLGWHSRLGVAALDSAGRESSRLWKEGIAMTFLLRKAQSGSPSDVTDSKVREISKYPISAPKAVQERER